MPVTINLGRINTCKIVGTKDRFIENRCIGESRDPEWECIDGTCIQYPGGQYASEAACLAAPSTNTCSALIDSGVQTNLLNVMLDWYISNVVHTTNYNAYFYETSIIDAGCHTSLDCCYGPNGGNYRILTHIYANTNAGLVGPWSDHASFLTWASTNCPTITAADNSTQINAKIAACFPSHTGATGLGLGGSPCTCDGCDDPPPTSWDCHEGAAGFYCVDPTDGSGQYATEADCLAAIAAGGQNSCDEDGYYGGPPGIGGSDRVNAAAGTIFTDPLLALEYYTTPANGISGTDAQTLFFEVYIQSATYPHGQDCSEIPVSMRAGTKGGYSTTSKRNCCPGPNSTESNPTTMVFLPYMGFVYDYIQTAGVNQGKFDFCCPDINAYAMDFDWTSHIGMYVPWLGPNADWMSVYGATGGTAITSWNWDEVLTDAIAAGAPINMSTPYSILTNVFVPGTFKHDMILWLASMPAINNSCYQTFQTCPTITVGNQYNPNICSGINACAPVLPCICEPGCDSVTYDCDPHTQQCYDPGTGAGQYTGPAALADCIAAGCGDPDSWDCIDGSCQSLGHGGGPFVSEAACLAASGVVNTCSTKTDVSGSLVPNPCIGGMGCEIQCYNLHVTNGTTGTPWENYFYESAIPNNNPGLCVGASGGELHIPNGFTIYKNGVIQHTCVNAGCTVDMVVAWCNANIGPGFLNTMTWLQMVWHSQTFPGWTHTPGDPQNIMLSHTYCQCSDCGALPWECTENGCVQQAGGSYATEAACLANMAIVDQCDGLTYTGSFADHQTARTDLTVNHPSTDITTLTSAWGPLNNIGKCNPLLTANQTHCIDDTTGNPKYSWGTYMFYDAVTSGALAGLALTYTTWNDFITAAQAIPITGIVPGVDFDTACAALNDHYATTPVSTCPIPINSNLVPGTWNCCSQGQWGNDSFYGIDGIMQYITTQANGFANQDAWHNFTGTPSTYTFVCNQPVCPGPGGCFSQYGCADPGNGCSYNSGISWQFSNWQGPNGPVYHSWDDVLTDLIAIGIIGVTPTSTWDDVYGCIGGNGWQNGLIFQSNNTLGIGGNLNIMAGYSPCDCSTTNTTVIPQCTTTYDCCRCEEGCPEPPPPAAEDCLVLWLHADRLDTITTSPVYPPNPPPLNPQTYYVTEWFNLAYDTVVGVYPYDPTAFYTYDTVTPDFTTAPILDTTTFSPRNAILFDEKAENALSKFLIANPSGPTPPLLQPDTNPNTAYEKGWTIFFLRCTSEDGWRNSHSWFMGDDMSVSDPGNQNMASGLKPAGQPYCKSNWFGHNHTNKATPQNDYKGSPINENTPLNQDYYLPEGCYLHWVVAEETLPTGTPNNTYSVTWGIGNMELFTDEMKDLDKDVIISNINTRNKNKSETQSGWYKEIRAYNCAFSSEQIQDEVNNIESYWGQSLLPQTLPLPCGSGPGVSMAFDGVDETRVEVQEGGGNTTILPSTTGFTAAFWVKFNDCVDEDACLFEKGINLPADNEQVAFRLYMTDDAAYAGKLYWDVFGDNPVDYTGNYGRTISNVAWLGAADCATMTQKWYHIAVTMSDVSGGNRKIYVNGEDVTAAGSTSITGQVKRNTEYPLNIGDSSRVDYTFKGNISQFATWNTELDAKTISKVYNNGELFDPNIDEASTLEKLMGVTPYTENDRLTFYTNFDTDPITHELSYPYTITKYGGVTADNLTADVVNVILPTDISGLQCWFKSNHEQLFDLDYSNNNIMRATYMQDNKPHLKDKLRLWGCAGSTGRYIMPDPLNTQAKKFLYQQTTEASAIVEPGGLYTNASKQMQIFHTKADGGIQFPAANGTVGAFTIMIKARMETFVNDALYGNTSDNMLRVSNTTTLRVKIGGAGSADFTVPSAMTDAQPYIITISRDEDGNLSGWIDGGAFTDQALTGTFSDADAFVIDYLGGLPSQGMKGWIFDFIAWETKLNETQRKGIYKVINGTVKTI